MSDIKFRVDGHLFRLKGNTLQVFIPDYDNNVGLGEMSGFFDTILSFGSSVADSVSSAVSSFSLSDILDKLPSLETVGKAINVAGSILAVKSTMAQADLINQQVKTQKAQEKAANKADVILSSSGPQAKTGIGTQALLATGKFPAGTTPSLDTSTLMLLGGGALVLFLAIRK